MPGRRPRRPPPPQRPDWHSWTSPGDLPPRLPYPPHHPPLLRRAAAAAEGEAIPPRRNRLLHRPRPPPDPPRPAWLHFAYARSMPVMVEERADWETPYDASHGGASARRRITSRRRFGRLTDFLAWRMYRRTLDVDDEEDDSLGLTYEELLELDNRNVKCGLSDDELATLDTFAARKEHMSAACHICLEGVEYAAALVRLDCNHTFHQHCIHRWLKQKRSCPTCRSEL